MTEDMEEEGVSINLLTDLDTRPVIAEDLQCSIQKDPILSHVRSFIQNGQRSTDVADEMNRAIYQSRTTS